MRPFLFAVAGLIVVTALGLVGNLVANRIDTSAPWWLPALLGAMGVLIVFAALLDIARARGVGKPDQSAAPEPRPTVRRGRQLAVVGLSVVLVAVSLVVWLPTWGAGDKSGSGGSAPTTVPTDPVRISDVVEDAVIDGGDTSAFALAFNPAGDRLAVGYGNGVTGRVMLWDVPGHRDLKHTDLDLGVRALAFRPDGRTLVIAGTGSSAVRIWDTDHDSVDQVWPIADNVYDLEAAAGDVAAGLARGDELRFWEIPSGRQRGVSLTPFSHDTTKLAVSPDGRYVAAVGRHEKSKSEPAGQVIEVATHDTVTRFGPDIVDRSDTSVTGLYSVAFSPDGSTLVTGGADHNVHLWATDDGEQVGPVLVGHTDIVTAVAVNPDGRTIASGGHRRSSEPGDPTVRLWDARTMSPTGGPLTGHTGSVTALAFSPDGRLLASASLDGDVRVWQLR